MKKYITLSFFLSSDDNESVLNELVTKATKHQGPVHSDLADILKSWEWDGTCCVKFKTT